ncbi:MAG: FKBP-type peptidyl-prolyl cis-trans isomerase [Bacteroidales bacterium]|nr:FKBP-type peptidyl-prolyl cis-trans isomerase [Bacteroidales bacterium]
MKKTTLYLALAAMAVCGCAKTPVAGLNDSAKLYFDSWMHVNYPDAQKTALGAYVLKETPGTGTQAGSSDTYPYLRVEYVMWDLEWQVGATTSEELCKQMGTYSPNDYYGPEIWAWSGNALTAGLEEAVSSMRVGGSKQFIVPGWLQTTERYDSEQGYLDNVSGSAAIYEVKLLELITDIKKWETDSIGSYISRNIPGKALADSLKYGFYYFESTPPSTGKTFSSDTTVYINYIGRLLNGKVFDTNVKDSAKFYGIYSASRTYEPAAVSITKGENDEFSVTMSSSSVINGFRDTILQMGPYAKGMSVFYSTLGYGSSGSGSNIPGYSPLRFDIEIVNKS